MQLIRRLLIKYTFRQIDLRLIRAGKAQPVSGRDQMNQAVIR